MAKKQNIGTAQAKTATVKKISSQKLLIIITAAVLALATIGLSIFFIVDAYNRNPRFDYLDSDLSKYIEFASDYKNFKVKINHAPLHKKNSDGTGVSDVEVEIQRLLAADRKLVGDGALNPSLTVGVGDNVYIWYRGYLKHPETGEKVIVGGMTNFGANSSSQLGIGTGSFPAIGLENALEGINPDDYARFEKITDATLEVDKEKHIIYASYTRREAGTTDSSKSTKYTNVRIDLSDTESVTESFGEGFIDKVNGKLIGSKSTITATVNDKNYEYKDFTVNFVTECEKESTNGGKPILTVECYFPYDYTSAYLRNETAYFEVYIEYVQDYTADEWNDEFVESLLSDKDSAITKDELLAKYTGETLTERYEKYIEATLVEANREERIALIEEAVWDHYLANCTVTRYPGEKVDEIYEEYVDDVEYQFSDEGTGGMLQDYEGNYQTFETLDEFAIAYLGLAEDADWRETLKTMSQNLVKERLILYYIMRDAKLTPTEAELSAKVESLKTEYLEEYFRQYLDNEGMTREDYSDEEYAKFVEDRTKEMFDYYDEDYFVETAYYEIVIEKITEWPEVEDLKDGAYPYAKVS